MDYRKLSKWKKRKAVCVLLMLIWIIAVIIMFDTTAIFYVTGIGGFCIFVLLIMDFLKDIKNE